MNRLQSFRKLPSDERLSKPARRFKSAAAILALASIATIGLCCKVLSAEPAPGAMTREIIFPQTDIGKLFFLGKDKKRTKDWFDVGEFTLIGPAKGKVKVPADVPLSLKLGYAATEKPSLVGGIPHDALTFIDGNRMPVEDPVCEYLAKLESLEKVDFAATELSDAGVKKLAKLPRLKVLHLESTNVHGEFVEEFARCKSSLRSLRFGNDSTTPAAWKMLANLKDLKRLDMYHCRLKDEALQYIGQMTALEQLRIPDNSKITDAGIQHLKNLKHLHYLSVEETHVTATGLCELKGLPITEMQISSSIDSKGEKKLRATFPNAKISVRQTKDDAETRFLFSPLK
jgi:hypothetical protein